MPPLSRTLQEAVATAAFHWALLAQEQRRMAAYEELLGFPRGSVTVYYNRARLYQRAAESLRREAWTGQLYCSMDGGAHPNYFHAADKAFHDPCTCGAAGCPWCRP